MPCVFCGIVAGTEPATVVASWPDALAITPLNPVTEGHTLVIPRVCVADAKESPELAASAMLRAADLASLWDSVNIITSVGVPATQTVFHLHIHVVPRRIGDGLSLPWTPRGA